MCFVYIVYTAFVQYSIGVRHRLYEIVRLLLDLLGYLFYIHKYNLNFNFTCMYSIRLLLSKLLSMFYIVCIFKNNAQCIMNQTEYSKRNSESSACFACVSLLVVNILYEMFMINGLFISFFFLVFSFL